MTTYKPVHEYSIDEVLIWVECIGLNSEPFRENAVDGDMLCHLIPEELTGELGLSGLQVKKFFQKLEFAKELSSYRAIGGGGEGDDAAARLAQLQAENTALKKEIQELQGVRSALSTPAPAPAPVYVPAPEPVHHHSPSPPQKHHHSPPPPQHRGPGVIGGAARGAAGGAIKGAIAGAILPGMSAGDGAAAGAAVGATTGGLRGARNRLRR